jgi:tetratricopeptide (TPR) repeat protein
MRFLQNLFTKRVAKTACDDYAAADAAWWSAQRLMLANYDPATETVPDEVVTEVMELLHKALIIGGPKESLYYGTLAQLYLTMHDFGKAYEVASLAVSLDPRNCESLRLKGNAAWMLGRPSEAEGLFRRALDIEPGHPALVQSLLLVKQERGQTQ